MLYIQYTVYTIQYTQPIKTLITTIIAISGYVLYCTEF